MAVVQITHPVTSATKEVDEGDLDRFLDGGWVDASPREFKDNSYAAIHPEVAEAQEQSEKDEASSAKPRASKTVAADPNAAGVKADAAPSDQG